MKFVFRTLASIVPAGIIVILTWINYNLHVGIGKDDGMNLVKQLNFIGGAIRGGADEDMQGLYPEGYMFLNCLYGLAWCDVLENVHPDASTAALGAAEIDTTLKKIQSERARAIFDRDLSITYGAFYTGWSNYLLGRKLEVMPSDTTGTAVFKKHCVLIADAAKLQFYPESYSSQAWPADAVVCIASLALHDRIFNPAYSETIQHWKLGVKKHLDPRGLIPHSALPGGKPVQQARGSSQTLMLSFLKEIDSAFAKEQFILFEENFVDSKVGLIGIREYPKDVTGLGDVDSGPVILGIGGAASIVGIRALSTYRHKDAQALCDGIEAFGLPTQNDLEKRYLFGMLPMADAFIVWSKCGIKNHTSDGDILSGTKFTIMSLILVALCGGLIYWFWR